MSKKTKSSTSELKELGLSNKKICFVLWYVDSDKTEDSYNKDCAKNTEVSYDTAMRYLQEPAIQDGIKLRMKAKETEAMLGIYDAMYQKALKGDVKAAEYIEKFYKSDFFGTEEKTEIDNILDNLQLD